MVEATEDGVSRNPLKVRGVAGPGPFFLGRASEGATEEEGRV